MPCHRGNAEHELETTKESSPKANTDKTKYKHNKKIRNEVAV
jgi:hypothetical protein